jgi:hypothetical protein
LTSGTVELWNNLNSVRLLSDCGIQVGWGRKKSASDLIIWILGAIRICKHQRFDGLWWRMSAPQNIVSSEVLIAVSTEVALGDQPMDLV